MNTSVKINIVLIAIIIILVAIGIWKYDEMDTDYQDLININKIENDSLVKVNIEIDHQIDSIQILIDSIGSRDTIRQIEYIKEKEEYEKTINFINNANTSQLNDLFTKYISPMDTLR